MLWFVALAIAVGALVGEAVASTVSGGSATSGICIWRDEPTLCHLILIGLSAGIVRDLLVTGGLTLPKRIATPDGFSIVRIGFLGSMLIGVAAAILFDGNLITAASSGIAGPEVIERVFNMKAMKGKTRNGGTNAGTPDQ